MTSHSPLLDYTAKVKTPFAVLGIRERGGRIIGFDYLASTTPEVAPKTPLAAEAVRQVNAFIDNARNGFDLPVSTQGTKFEDRVWREISAIPPGEVRTYGDIARKVATMPRAVGGACGRNPLPLIVPCHRVVASGGRIGGFMGGAADESLAIKRWLLAHEGASLVRSSPNSVGLFGPGGDTA